MPSQPPPGWEVAPGRVVGGRDSFNLSASSPAHDQLLETDPLDVAVFVPALREKPFAFGHPPAPIPYEPRYDSLGNVENPYEVEIRAFKPILSKELMPLPSAIEDVPAVWVDTPEQLPALIRDIGSCSVIGVDLEHDAEVSYLGTTCLIQISTDTRDYVIDAIALSSELGDALRAPFADPSLVKVVHAALGDVDWLQRDFGLYFVGLFDTAEAAKLLGLPATISDLMMQLYGIEAPKKPKSKRGYAFTWSQRPLPLDNLAYARADTHNLAALYRGLNNELLAEHFDYSAARGATGGIATLMEAWDRSSTLALRQYAFPVLTAKFLQNQGKKVKSAALDDAQKPLFYALLVWREELARRLNRSPYTMIHVDALARMARAGRFEERMYRKIIDSAVTDDEMRQAALARAEDAVANADHLCRTLWSGDPIPRVGKQLN